MSQLEYRAARVRHYARLVDLDSELRVYIRSICEAVKAGTLTPEKALAAIQAKAAANGDEIRQSWHELLRSAR